MLKTPPRGAQEADGGTRCGKRCWKPMGKSVLETDVVTDVGTDGEICVERYSDDGSGAGFYREPRAMMSRSKVSRLMARLRRRLR